MFCFQCEQTANGKGCQGKAGVCGKPSVVAKLQDELTGAIIGLARVVKGTKPTAELTKLITGALFTTITNVNFDEKTVSEYID